MCNPMAVRSAWFGQNDAPEPRAAGARVRPGHAARFGWAAASLAGAVLLKQFALVALPFLALMSLKAGAAALS